MKIEMNTSILPIVVPDTYGTDFWCTIQEYYWDDFKKYMIDHAVDCIKENLVYTIFEDAILTPKGMTSPREYNFNTDRVDFFMEFSDDLIEQIKVNINADETEFFNWAKEKYHSYDGFISFMPYEKADYYKAIDKPANDKYDYDKERAIAMYIMYQLRELKLDKIQDDYLDDCLEYAYQNGMEEYDDEE